MLGAYRFLGSVVFEIFREAMRESWLGERSLDRRKNK
jgi:hypothetical protein